MNKTTIALIIAASSILAISYVYTKSTSKKSSSSDTQSQSEAPTYQNISADELKAVLDTDKDIFLVDVHTPEQEHIKNTDAFIPFDEITENGDKLPQNKDTEIVVYCRSGNMSVYASEKLLEMGYTNIKNLVGGTKAWNAKGYDVDQHSMANFNKPVAETHKKTHNFGQIKKADGIVSVEFEIENHGKELLEIGDISTSCGCTSAEIDKTTLGFNEYAKLTVHFDPDFHEEPEGKFSRSVFVQTNDPDLPEMQFDIQVEIVE